LKVIEDAAEVIGQTYRGRPCGSFGEISAFSFYPNKHVTTGEGGMLVTDDPALAEKCRSLRNLCFKPEQRFVHDELGWNFRMTNLQAAVGVAQLERLDQSVRIKRRMGARYDELITGTRGIQLPLARTPYAENIYWVYGLVLDDTVPFDAREAMARLARLGIGTRPFFWPMHEQPVLRRKGLFGGDRHPVAERLARRGFYIPSGMALTDAQIERTARAVKQILA
jgi:perosamine synthetase